MTGLLHIVIVNETKIVYYSYTGYSCKMQPIDYTRTLIMIKTDETLRSGERQGCVL